MENKRIDFEITTYEFRSQDFDSWEFPNDYHCLYILENGKDAYIGETSDPIRRSNEHNYEKDLCKEYNFQRIYVITGNDFEETPMKHFEKLLIKLMRVDQKFHIVNRNDGEQTYYARKNVFELCFDKLWIELEKFGLVRHKEFQAILNTSVYKFSPEACLTEGQYVALTSIVHTIDSEETIAKKKEHLNRPILICGDAGTGKTVVATSLFNYLKTNERYKDKKIGFVYAMTSTRDEIQGIFKHIAPEFRKDIISPVAATKENYDILICDEAHRLRRGKNIGKYSIHFNNGNKRLGLAQTSDELDWLLMQSKLLVLFYDKKQIVSASDISSEDFYARLCTRNRGIRPVELKDQMRIQAGDQYVSYIYNILYQTRTEPMQFENYDFRLFSSFKEMIERLRECEEKMGLCRLCGGYAWKWITQDTMEIPDLCIEDVGIYWNSQTGGWLRNDASKEEMGSIYSLAGLDLNYTAVVIGPDIYYDTKKRKIKVNKKHFFDNKVKKNVMDEELREYILNTYAVLLTRGIYGTYIYVCDDALREYLKRFIPVV